VRTNVSWIFGFLLVLACLSYGQEAQAQGRRVVCESHDEQTRSCSIGRNGGVEISRRLSDSRCERGRDWWVDGRRIVVTDGCRAEFIVYGDRGSYGYGYNDERYDDKDAYSYGSNRIRCESRDDRPTSCQIGRYREVRIARQLSDSRCSEGRDWWLRGPELVVLNGCRAEFAISR